MWTPPIRPLPATAATLLLRLEDGRGDALSSLLLQLGHAGPNASTYQVSATDWLDATSSARVGVSMP